MSFENSHATKGSNNAQISVETRRRAVEAYGKQQPTRLSTESTIKNVQPEKNLLKETERRPINRSIQDRSVNSKKADLGENLMNFFGTTPYEPPKTSVKDNRFFTNLADAREEVGKTGKELEKTRKEIQATSTELKNSITGVGKLASNEVKDFVKNLFTGWFKKKTKDEAQPNQEVSFDNNPAKREKIYLQDLPPNEQYEINDAFRRMNEDSLISIRQAYEQGNYTPEDLEKALKAQKELMEEYSAIKDLDVERFRDDIMNEKSKYKTEKETEAPIRYENLSLRDKKRIDEVFEGLSKKLIPSQKQEQGIGYQRSMKKYNQEIADLETLKTLDVKKFVKLVESRYGIDFNS
ncbi:MAG: hypothetical protein PHR00_00625 [Patescibacteria group bacterium]|nr:hypothetical protein [Patescibacteria group bacterium]